VNSIGANVRRTSAVDLGGAERGAVPTRWRMPTSVRPRVNPTGSFAGPSVSAISPAPRVPTTGLPARRNCQYTAGSPDNTLVTSTR